MPDSDPSPEARLDVVELLLCEMLAVRPPADRAGIVDRARAVLVAREAEAVLSGNPAHRVRAAEMRVALERMTE